MRRKVLRDFVIGVLLLFVLPLAELSVAIAHLRGGNRAGNSSRSVIQSRYTREFRFGVLRTFYHTLCQIERDKTDESRDWQQPALSIPPDIQKSLTKKTNRI